MFLEKRLTLSVACKFTQNFANNLTNPVKSSPEKVWMRVYKSNEYSLCSFSQ